MPKYTMYAPVLPNVPWQDKPAGHINSPLWRYTENPIIDRNPLPGVARIFNSAVMPYEGKFVGVFRGEQTNGVPYIYLGWSQDAIHWDFEPDKIPVPDLKKMNEGGLGVFIIKNIMDYVKYTTDEESGNVSLKMVKMLDTLPKNTEA